MNEMAEQAVGVVEAKLQELLAGAATESVRVKLRNIHDTCRHLVVTAKQRLTVPSIVAAYSARHVGKDQSIAESSIRNKRTGGNPYQELYRAWESAAEVILQAPTRAGKAVAGEILAMGDLGSIADPTIRHQVKLLIIQNRSLKSQLDILKKVRGAPVIRLEATHPDSVAEPAASLSLTESEISALADFVTPKRLQERGLQHDDSGALLARGGKDLSDPGFLDALHKVLAHVQG